MAPSSLRELVGQLEQLYSSSSTSTSSKPLLTQAKVQLAQSGLLLPSKPSSKGVSSSDLEAAREILSYGALLSLRERDFDSFQRYILQVKPFWDPALGCVVLSHRDSFCLSTLLTSCLPSYLYSQPIQIKTTTSLDRSISTTTTR